MKESTRNCITASSAMVAAIAVPLIVAIIGAGIQRELSGQEDRRAFVGIAVQILSSESTGQADQRLREWA